jgi:hypothetical protein
MPIRGSIRHEADRKPSLSVEVEVTTRDSLHPLPRDDIERSAIRVF